MTTRISCPRLLAGVVFLTVCVAAALLGLEHWRLVRKVDRILAEREALTTELESRARLELLERAFSDFKNHASISATLPLEAAPLNPGQDHGNVSEPPSTHARLTALEKRFEEAAPAITSQRASPGVPEYDVTKPPPIEPEPLAPTNALVRPSWNHAQAAGPPDTAQAGDFPTAWASRQPDAGTEWLWVDFDKAVEVEQVRIRESYNPGAISKVTGQVDGQEVVLWEGTAAGGAAPRDFVVPVYGKLLAQSIVVHLDTARVPGWNEIDAVELVGRDGSRQWAKSSNASSSYSDR